MYNVLNNGIWRLIIIYICELVNIIDFLRFFSINDKVDVL